MVAEICNRSVTYIGGVAWGSSGCGGCRLRSVDANVTPESVASYPPEDSSCSEVTVDSPSGAACTEWRNAISYSAADVGRAAGVGRERVAVRGVVFLCELCRDNTKLRFCMRRVLACHFFNVRSRFASSSSATPKNLATLCFTDLQMR